ncbi:DNA polymerase I [Ornithinibacillus sp. 4-3]|uniref:DNA polymerase I n=1 Tax=Ornithinibacillus sp. 4-3 TaxID=3231488 RepID=A0AB39HI66_9BACI
MSQKLVLIDGNSIIFRAFYALPLLNNDKGVYTNAVYGFTTMLMNIIEEEQPTHMLVAFDAGKTTFRHKTYQDYKGGRQKTPPELSEQMPLVRELLDAFQIKYYELDQYEADDIIGTLATEGKKENWNVKVISGDQDLLQLVSENVTVDLTKKGISEVNSYTPESLLDQMELTPEQIIDLKALMGDSSDNIPGVPGVGIKTATKLLKQYQTVEKVYEHIDEISGKKLKENLINHQDDAFLSKELATINCNSPIQVALEDIPFQELDQDKAHAFFTELGFKSLIDKLDVDSSGQAEQQDEIEYTIVEKIEAELFSKQDAILLEMLGENYHQADILGIGLVNQNGKYFIPLELALESADFKAWAEDETIEKYVFDAKGTIVALLHHGIQMRGIVFDLLLSSYLLNPAESHDDIPSIAHRVNLTQVSLDEAVYGKGAKQKVPELTALADHVVRKTNVIFQLKDQFLAELEKNDQYHLYEELELPLALILAEMEFTGIKVNKQTLEDMGNELKEKLAALEEEIYELAGEEFNLNSPKQLGPILFEKLGLPVIKKTKTGYSTAVDVLEKLEDKHEIISKIMMYRQLGKLQSTYIEGLLKVIDKDTSKIHTRFNQALTQTGRLSSIDPNLQNIPIRLEEGRKIRQAFVASEEGWKIFGADYSQIELRVLAHIANDERLIDAFNNDLDIHTQTASDVFHVDASEVTSNMRSSAKAVNFGIVYGMSDYGLSQNLGITRKEAQKFIDRYFESYPNVKEYMEDIVLEAKQTGYVATIMKRRRYLPEINSRNFNVRSFAERTAMNTPIQGSAADIIKQAMIDLHAKLKEENLQARILLQVHDELIIEAPEEEIEKLEEIVPAMMEKTVKLSVPLKVDYAHGDSWYDV